MSQPLPAGHDLSSRSFARDTLDEGVNHFLDDLETRRGEVPISPEIRDQVRQTVGSLALAAETGHPIIFINPNAPNQISSGGRLDRPISLTLQYGHSDLTLGISIASASHREWRRPNSLLVNPQVRRILNAAETGGPPPFYFRAGPIAEWAAEYLAPHLGSPRDNSAEFYRTRRNLSEFFRAGLGPAELDMDPEVVATLREILFEGLFHDAFGLNDGETLGALCFINDAHDEQAFEGLINELDDRLCDLLPADPDELTLASTSLLTVVSRLKSYQKETPYAYELPSGRERDDYIRAIYLAKLYARRAARLAASRQTVVTVPGPTTTEPIEKPEVPKRLALADSYNTLPARLKWEEIDMLARLRAQAAPVDAYVHRTPEGVRAAYKQVLDLARETVEDADRRKALLAIEYLASDMSEEERIFVYEQMAKTMALNMPFDGTQTRELRQHLRIAKTIGELTPEVFKAEDGTELHGAARTAHVMSTMYANRAEQLMYRQRARQRALNGQEPDGD